jgi:hypothetical protein
VNNTKESLTLIEVKPGVKFSLHTLKQCLPDPEMVFWFGKLYNLSASQVSAILHYTHKTSLTEALLGEGGLHSHELQDYLLELGYESLCSEGEITFGNVNLKGEILPELWASLEIEIADSIKEVAETIKDVVGHLPGKQGEMLFKSMKVLNAKRPVLGDYRAYIHHAPGPANLVILDVSGSMSEGTVRTIIEDVVALSFMANAHFAIVSSTCTHWSPGEFTVEAVLEAAEYGGTHYETLAPLFMDRNWGVVVTLADYDSAATAKGALAKCTGTIERLLDISLVNRPTYLAEVLGQLAKEIRPLLVGSSTGMLSR